MKTKRLKNLYGLAAAGILMLILLAGVLLSGRFGDWFHRNMTGDTKADVIEGDVSIVRGGTDYVLKKGIVLQENDTVVAGKNARFVSTAEGRLAVTADGESRITFEALQEENTAIAVRWGAVLFESVQKDNRTEAGKRRSKAKDSGQTGTAAVLTDTMRILLDEGDVVAAEVYNGTETVSVFDGAPVMEFESRKYALLPGDRITVITDQDKSELLFNRVLASDLKEFFIDQLIIRGGLLFTTEKLQSVIDARKESAGTVQHSEDELICTIEVHCDTCLDHLAEVSAETAKRIPADGVLLPRTVVTLERGDSVYDVLRRTCLNAGVVMNDDYAVTLSGYYIKNIGGISEKDFGPVSGWTYEVNGWYPNFGCERYEVEDGDVIIWNYTCVGLGEDLGLEPWKEGREELKD